MVLVRLSGNIADMIGKQGGSCWARNHYGLYMKNWQRPFNPQTDYQNNNRDNFKMLVLHWPQLSESQRINWNLLGASLHYKNKVGDAYSPSGFDVYLSCNQNLYLIGQPTIDDSPSVPVIDQFSDTSFIFDPSTFNVSGVLIKGTIHADIYYLVYVTKSFSSGRYYMTQNFSQFNTIDDSTPNWSISNSSYLSRWSMPFMPGLRYFFKFIPIHKTSGFAGIQFIRYLTIPTANLGFDFGALDVSFILI